MRYPVELVHEDNRTVTAIVPDLPGTFTFGEDQAEALMRSVDAIETAMIALIADREAIPRPSRAGRRLTVGLPALSVAKIAIYETMRTSVVGKAELALRLGGHLRQVPTPGLASRLALRSDRGGPPRPRP